MNIKNISKEEADKLIEEESHFFDQKAKEISGDKVQKISVAFANTDGGEFCIGIKDKKDEPITENRWDGFDTMEEYNAILSNFLSISPCLEYLRYASNFLIISSMPKEILSAVTLFLDFQTWRSWRCR